MDLQFIAEAWIQTVINTHYPRSVDLPIAIVRDIHDFFVNADHALAGSPELKEAGFTKVQLGKWYLQIVSTPSQLNRVPFGPAASLALPEYLLTPLKYWNQDALANTFTVWRVSKMYNGVCRIRQLQHIWNGVAPRLVRASPNWAYAVRTKHAYNLIVKAVVHGKVLINVEKLAVLDELYLF
ncbi:hypothetical protein Slin14017_G117430 [Septoria linicola]|nr:hypothetical protein Slin14017_G117430 [Septoria linicola]